MLTVEEVGLVHALGAHAEMHVFPQVAPFRLRVALNYHRLHPVVILEVPLLRVQAGCAGEPVAALFFLRRPLVRDLFAVPQFGGVGVRRGIYFRAAGEAGAYLQRQFLVVERKFVLGCAPIQTQGEGAGG